MIYHLIYRSVPARAMDWKTLSAIIKQAQDKNRRDSITGLLLWLDQAFLQVLEGPRPQVSACFQRIANDPRHQQVELMTLHSVSTRLFPDWRMRALNFMGLGPTHQELLLAKYGGKDGRLSIPDDESFALAMMLDALHLSRSLKQDDAVATPAEPA